MNPEIPMEVVRYLKLQRREQFREMKRMQLRVAVNAVSSLLMSSAYCPGGGHAIQAALDQLESLYQAYSKENWN